MGRQILYLVRLQWRVTIPPVINLHLSPIGSEWSGVPWRAAGHHGGQWRREDDAPEHADVPLVAQSAGQRAADSERRASEFQHSGRSVGLRATTRPLHRDANSARASHLPGSHCVGSSCQWCHSQ